MREGRDICCAQFWGPCLRIELAPAGSPSQRVQQAAAGLPVCRPIDDLRWLHVAPSDIAWLAWNLDWGVGRNGRAEVRAERRDGVRCYLRRRGAGVDPWALKRRNEATGASRVDFKDRIDRSPFSVSGTNFAHLTFSNVPSPHPSLQFRSHTVSSRGGISKRDMSAYPKQQAPK